jgi:hypothetical protein
MALTLANTNLILDNACRYYERIRGVDSASAYGVGESTSTYQAYGAADAIVDGILATADSAVISGLLTVAERMMNATGSARIARDRLRPTLVALERMIRDLALTGVTTIEEYLAYYNTGSGGTWTALQSAQWRDLFYAWKGAYPDKTNCYFEIVQGGTFRGTTYTDALGKFVVSGAGAGTFTDGTAVDYTKYSGGTGKINVSSLTGSGNVTITGIGMDPATGEVTTSKTWITSISGTGLTTVVVGGGTAPANCLLVDITNVTIAAGITAGTFYIECHRPAAPRLQVPY